MKSHGTCTVQDCERPAHYKQDMICQMHYFRRMRNGGFDLKKTKYEKQGYYEHSNGYRLLVMPDHPLARKGGEVFEHRVVAFEKYGFDLPPCEFCGAESDWFTRKTHIDHVDEDRANNHPDNLRVLCNSCNTKRTKKIYHSYDHCMSVTVDGVTMTPTEWSRQPRVSVTAATIRHRIASGYSHKEAVYSPKKTHNGNERKRPPCPPKHTRRNAVSLTIDGVKKTSAEWSRHPDCNVCDSTIRMRKRKGLSDRDCVFGPPRTGFKARSVLLEIEATK